ncbi:MAG: HAMP domain-containing sensor histidine kinase [Bacteroidota bacterium]
MESTKFAPARRASTESFEADYNLLNDSEWLTSFINTMPEVVAILNKERQIVFGNKELLNLINITDLKSLIGKRPGEALNCVNSAEHEAGCGTCEKCRYCGAVKSILESQSSLQKVTKDCRITIEVKGKHEYLDLMVTTAPFFYQDHLYFILSIEDISDKNRRAMLEKIFYHDILNIVGSLNGVSELLVRSQKDEETAGKYIGIVNNLSKELLDEILSQRVMVFAEEGDLVAVLEVVNTIDIINEVATYLSHHTVCSNRNIEIQKLAYSGLINTDPMLLKRVIINMTKNALEATPKAGVVYLNCILENDSILFTVQNPGEMHANVKAQVFQRSFTTKGKGRGLGTYSIKLLTEQYLKGTVGFTSTEENGTAFFVNLPNKSNAEFN